MNTKPTKLSSRNDAVTVAYFAMLKVAKQLLSTIESHEIRCTLYRQKEPDDKPDIIHEFVSPLLYLRLESYDDGTLGIHYGFEPCKTYEHITLPFCRSVYRLSGKENTAVNIEDGIRTDWVIFNPDDMYQYIEEQNKYHTFELIKYKPSANRRKQMKAVA